MPFSRMDYTSNRKYIKKINTKLLFKLGYINNERLWGNTANKAVKTFLKEMLNITLELDTNKYATFDGKITKTGKDEMPILINLTPGRKVEIKFNKMFDDNGKIYKHCEFAYNTNNQEHVPNQRQECLRVNATLIFVKQITKGYRQNKKNILPTYIIYVGESENTIN